MQKCYNMLVQAKFIVCHTGKRKQIWLVKCANRLQRLNRNQFIVVLAKRNKTQDIWPCECVWICGSNESCALDFAQQKWSSAWEWLDLLPRSWLPQHERLAQHDAFSMSFKGSVVDRLSEQIEVLNCVSHASVLQHAFWQWWCVAAKDVCVAGISPSPKS